MSTIVGRKKLTNALGMRRNDSPYSNNRTFRMLTSVWPRGWP